MRDQRLSISPLTDMLTNEGGSKYCDLQATEITKIEACVRKVSLEDAVKSFSNHFQLEGIARFYNI